jgi:hypothetical protein
MGAKTKPAKTEVQEEPPAKRKICVELQRGSVSVSRNGLTFCITGKDVKLHKQSPLTLTFVSGEVQFDDNEIAIRAEGDFIKLQLD